MNGLIKGQPVAMKSLFSISSSLCKKNFASSAVTVPS
jgi:hypothetical protein